MSRDSDARIQAMDEACTGLFVLSQTSPGVQAESDAAAAVERARACNDCLQSQIEAR